MQIRLVYIRLVCIRTHTHAPPPPPPPPGGVVYVIEIGELVADVRWQIKCPRSDGEQVLYLRN